MQTKILRRFLNLLVTGALDLVIPTSQRGPLFYLKISASNKKNAHVDVAFSIFIFRENKNFRVRHGGSEVQVYFDQ
jgi:hypothetical protein